MNLHLRATLAPCRKTRRRIFALAAIALLAGMVAATPGVPHPPSYEGFRLNAGVEEGQYVTELDRLRERVAWLETALDSALDSALDGSTVEELAARRDEVMKLRVVEETLRRQIDHLNGARLDTRCFLNFINDTKSMLPTFDSEDVLVICTDEASLSTLYAGDIITFSPPWIPNAYGDFVHRIAEVQNAPDGTVYITAGDNSGTDREPVPHNKVTGKVVGIIYGARPAAQ